MFLRIKNTLAEHEIERELFLKVITFSQVLQLIKDLESGEVSLNVTEIFSHLANILLSGNTFVKLKKTNLPLTADLDEEKAHPEKVSSAGDEKHSSEENTTLGSEDDNLAGEFHACLELAGLLARIHFLQQLSNKIKREFIDAIHRETESIVRYDASQKPLAIDTNAAIKIIRKQYDLLLKPYTYSLDEFDLPKKKLVQERRPYSKDDLDTPSTEFVNPNANVSSDNKDDEKKIHEKVKRYLTEIELTSFEFPQHLPLNLLTSFVTAVEKRLEAMNVYENEIAIIRQEYLKNIAPHYPMGRFKLFLLFNGITNKIQSFDQLMLAERITEYLSDQKLFEPRYIQFLLLVPDDIRIAELNSKAHGLIISKVVEAQKGIRAKLQKSEKFKQAQKLYFELYDPLYNGSHPQINILMEVVETHKHRQNRALLLQRYDQYGADDLITELVYELAKRNDTHFDVEKYVSLKKETWVNQLTEVSQVQLDEKATFDELCKHNLTSDRYETDFVKLSQTIAEALLVVDGMRSSDSHSADDTGLEARKNEIAYQDPARQHIIKIQSNILAGIEKLVSQKTYIDNIKIKIQKLSVSEDIRKRLLKKLTTYEEQHAVMSAALSRLEKSCGELILALDQFEQQVQPLLPSLISQHEDNIDKLKAFADKAKKEYEEFIVAEIAATKANLEKFSKQKSLELVNEAFELLLRAKRQLSDLKLKLRPMLEARWSESHDLIVAAVKAKKQENQNEFDRVLIGTDFANLKAKQGLFGSIVRIKKENEENLEAMRQIASRQNSLDDNLSFLEDECNSYVTHDLTDKSVSGSNNERVAQPEAKKNYRAGEADEFPPEKGNADEKQVTVRPRALPSFLKRPARPKVQEEFSSLDDLAENLMSDEEDDAVRLRELAQEAEIQRRNLESCKINILQFAQEYLLNSKDKNTKARNASHADAKKVVNEEAVNFIWSIINEAKASHVVSRIADFLESSSKHNNGKKKVLTRKGIVVADNKPEILEVKKLLSPAELEANKQAVYQLFKDLKQDETTGKLLDSLLKVDCETHPENIQFYVRRLIRGYKKIAAEHPTSVRNIQVALAGYEKQFNIITNDNILSSNQVEILKAQAIEYAFAQVNQLYEAAELFIYQIKLICPTNSSVGLVNLSDIRAELANYISELQEAMIKFRLLLDQILTKTTMHTKEDETSFIDFFAGRLVCIDSEVAKKGARNIADYLNQFIDEYLIIHKDKLQDKVLFIYFLRSTLKNYLEDTAASCNDDAAQFIKLMQDQCVENVKSLFCSNRDSFAERLCESSVDQRVNNLREAASRLLHDFSGIQNISPTEATSDQKFDAKTNLETLSKMDLRNDYNASEKIIAMLKEFERKNNLGIKLVINKQGYVKVSYIDKFHAARNSMLTNARFCFDELESRLEVQLISQHEFKNETTMLKEKVGALLALDFQKDFGNKMKETLLGFVKFFKEYLEKLNASRFAAHASITFQPAQNARHSALPAEVVQVSNNADARP